MIGNDLSYVHGTSLKPLLGETIGRNFDRAADTHATREALIVPHQNVRRTYDELKEQVNCLASGLLSLGLEPGDRVGIWSPKNSQWVVTQFATAKAGLILVNINPAYRLGELLSVPNRDTAQAKRQMSQSGTKWNRGFRQAPA